MKNKKKGRLIAFLMSCAFLAFCLSSSAFAQLPGVATIEKIYVSKACYQPGDTAHIEFLVNNSGGAIQESAEVKVSHLENVIWTTTVPVSLDANASASFSFDWQTPAEDFKGYLVQITLCANTYVSAIDVSSDVSRYPRYGYSVDFMPGESVQESDAMMKELAQVYHINLVQYYDWMYRHEKALPDEGDEWVDMFGHTLSRQTIQQRINAGHQYNQKAMAYQMSYMAREGYTANGVDKTWGLFSDPIGRNIDYDPGNNSTLANVDQFFFPMEGKPAPILFAFNPLNTNWQNFMVGQYKLAINELGFDGIQIDQMGDFWGNNVTYYDYEGNSVNLGSSFAPFTNVAKEQLTQNNSSKNIVTMNAVNGGNNDYFSTNAIITQANTDFAFSELWGNSDTYQKINDFVKWQRMSDGGKTMVLAAYMNQYDINGDTYYYEDAALQGGVHTNTDGELTYITGFDEEGDSASLTVTVPETGNYSLVFYAANGTDTQASKSIYVDGEKYMTAYFDSTRSGIIPAEPDWSTYSYEASFTMPKNLYLTEGNHTITVRQDVDDIGGDIRLHSLTFGTYDKNSVQLANAAIAASGAMHIELGSGMSVGGNSNSRYNDFSLLGNPYYPKAAKSMTQDTAQAVGMHYQFITAYENLLYDADVLPSDSGWQNIQITGQSISGDAQPGTIWYILKNKGNEYGIIHLINLTAEQDQDWRNVTAEPEEKNNLQVKYYLPQFKSVEGVYMASSDLGCVSQELNFTIGNDAVGKYVAFTVPSLKYWDMVYIAYGNETSGNRIEAESAILTNVNIATNHPGYSGTGFVDSYGKNGDAVTMDFYLAQEGDYNLDFVYAAAVEGTPQRKIYIDGYGFGEIQFPPNGSWDEWASSRKTVHLRRGIHRMVIQAEGAAPGYINLDCVDISAVG